MSNEELARAIQGGDNGLVCALWEAVKRFIYQSANRYYGRMKDRCAVAGVSLADLEQEGYFALIEAVGAYDGRYGFLSYLRYPLLNRFNAMLGIRRRDPLNNAASLDAPISEDEGARLQDSIADEDAQAAFVAVEDSLYYAKQKEDVALALGTIAPDKAEALRGAYFRGLTMAAAAEEANTDLYTMQRRRTIGLKELRRPAAMQYIREYRADIISHYAYRGSLSSFRTDGLRSTERAAIKLIGGLDNRAGEGKEKPTQNLHKQVKVAHNAP